MRFSLKPRLSNRRSDALARLGLQSAATIWKPHPELGRLFVETGPDLIYSLWDGKLSGRGRCASATPAYRGARSTAAVAADGAMLSGSYSVLVFKAGADAGHVRQRPGRAGLAEGRKHLVVGFPRGALAKSCTAYGGCRDNASVYGGRPSPSGGEASPPTLSAYAC